MNKKWRNIGEEKEEADRSDIVVHVFSIPASFGKKKIR
jgi:hypothetical protein